MIDIEADDKKTGACSSCDEMQYGTGRTRVAVGSLLQKQVFYLCDACLAKFARQLLRKWLAED